MKQSIFDVQHLYIKDYLFQLFPAGKIIGKEFVVGDVHGGAGSSLNFHIEKACGQDFATGSVYKNIVELIMEKFGLEEQAAFKKIEDDWGIEKKAPLKLVEKPKVKQVKAIPFDKEMPLTVSVGKHGAPTNRWLYETADGQGICWILRFDYIDEKNQPAKDYRPYIYGDDQKWHNKGMDTPRSLYNLPDVIKSKDIVVIAEGEKAAEAAKLLLPAMTVTTNAHGSQAIKQTDWSPLQGKKVLLWRDNDVPGEKWQKQLAEILANLDCTVRVFKDDAFLDRPKGWDAADLLTSAEFQGNEIYEWVKHNIMEYRRGGVDTSASTVDGEKSAHVYEEPLNRHYRCLGMVGNKFALYNYHSGQVEEKTTDGFTESYCRALVCGATDYWKSVLQTGHGDKISWKSIVGVIAKDFYNLGQFDTDRIRGLGCWIDNKRIVFNAGDFLYVEGQKIPINNFESYYVYTRSTPILTAMHEEVTENELYQFKELCNMFSWEYPVSGNLLAGWLMIAPICGALPWRPHIYITGMAGTGKSTIHDNLLARTLGNCSVVTLGDSTKAGLAQSTMVDALPIIFDEIENDSKIDEMRNDTVLRMARYSSSSQKGKTLKGRADQSGAEGYVSRSCFCFSSITPSVKHYADYSRITLLPLMVDHSATKEVAVQHYEKITSMISDIMGDDTNNMKFSERFVTYANRNVLTIIESYKILKKKAQLTLPGFSARIADQVGMLLAGYWAYGSDKVISEQEAETILTAYNWDDLIPSKKLENQSVLVSKLMQHKLWMMNEASQKKYPRTLASVIDYVTYSSITQHKDEVYYDRKYAQDILQDMGIRIEIDSGRTYVAIANSSNTLAHILQGTQWAANWNGSLRAINGAFSPKSAKWFGSAIGSQRCTYVPIEVFVSSEEGNA